MAGRFEKSGDGAAAVALDGAEISILRSLAVQLLELIGPGEGPADGDDPLAALFAEGPSEPPSDPALARLFPDAYGEPGAPPDEETRRLSAEFRRFTETELRTAKRENLLLMVGGLDAAARDAAETEGDALLTLEADASRRWLGALNDMRLALGSRLGLSDDESSDRLFDTPQDDPGRPLVIAYSWLGLLQESLIETLAP
ncbi:DUF2017 domain-containing protein [Streptomyces avicenniae]|uniref:DUF2017 domain-containing protein n=1 Tax=Streptomyces avicenniae TaxID=500153 RepID=UPI00069BB19F|nr:DUF2017 domain-containing protein [Streptomyces avicenniae]